MQLPRRAHAIVHGWHLSIVPTKLNLVGIVWRDVHLPVNGKIVPMLNYYEGVYQIVQLNPPTVSSITIETDSSTKQMLLNPDKSDWFMRFHARRIYAMIKSYAQVHFSPFNHQTVRISKFISRMSGTPPINTDNIAILYNSICDRDQIFFCSFFY